MRIQHNIQAIRAQRQTNVNSNAASKSLEKLSSGFAINRAADGAASLAISEKMRSQIRGLDRATSNAQDSISLMQTAEGALQETQSILQRMRELSVQSANGIYQAEDREKINDEFKELSSEITRIAENTKFNDINVLSPTTLETTDGISVDGFKGASNITVGLDATGAGAGNFMVSFTGTDGTATTNQAIAVSETDNSDGTFTYTGSATVNGQSISLSFTNTGKIADGANDYAEVSATPKEMSFQIGATSSESISVSIKDMSAGALGVDGAIDVKTVANANSALTAIDSAIGEVSKQRAKLGSTQNRIEHAINNLGVSVENLTAAESRIRDVDMAKEMMNFTKNNILMQASQSMLAQANAQPQSVLQLLG